MDGLVDYPSDPGCFSPAGKTESCSCYRRCCGYTRCGVRSELAAHAARHNANVARQECTRMTSRADRAFDKRLEMEGHPSAQPRELFSVATFCVLLLTLDGCALFDHMGGLDGLDGPYFGEAVSVSGSSALVGSPGFAFSKKPGLAHVFERRSGSWRQISALSAEDGRSRNDGFGSAVALTEDTALVGAWGTDGVAPVSGSAYIFERSRDGWRQSAVLVNPDASERHLLGDSVAVDAGTAVVGAPGVNRKLSDDTSDTVPEWSGAVYVWSKNETGWRYRARITPDFPSSPPSPSAQQRPYHLWRDFGRNVAIHGDILVVSAQDETTDPGTVYVFRRVNDVWKQDAKLEEQQACFGIEIAVFNETVVVASSASLSVYVRADDVWRLQARLSPNVAGGDAGFRNVGPVSINENVMVVGAPRHKKRRGAAFIFERLGEEWKQVAMLTGDDTRSDGLLGQRAGDMFGGSVSIHGDVILVGASFHDSEGPNYGAAYVFRREGSRWIQESKLVSQISESHPH